MATNITLNSVSYSIPAVGESSWGTSLSAFLIALPTGVLSKAGGSFPLTAVADFGANFGLKSLYFSSRGTASSAGLIRLAVSDSIGWRNAGNSADLLLNLSSDALTFNSNPVLTLANGASNTLLKMNSGGTTFEYGLLANANVEASAAIAYSKLNLATSIVNADVSTSAAIAHSKFANITAGSVLLGNASNVPTATALSGDVTVNSSGVTAISAGVIVNAHINASAAIARTKLASGTASHVIINDGSGVISSEEQLATSRGGTGQNSTATFPTSGVVVTESATQTLLNKTISTTAAATGAFLLPPGTTAQRPTPASGHARFNTDTNEFEGYANGAWSSIGGGINEQALKNYLKTYATASIAPGTLSTLASTTANLVSLTAFYADSTSGTAALTQSSSTTLRGATNYLSSVSGAALAGTSFLQLPAFALEGSDLGKPVSINFDINSTLTSGDWDVVVVRYNSSGTHQSIISVAGNASTASATPSARLPGGTSQFNGFFVPDSTTAGDLYALRFRRLVGSVQVRLDTLFAGPQPVRTGAPVTDWVSYTPSGPWNTNTTYTGQWKRVGDSIELLIDAAFSGAPNAASANFTFAQLLNGLSLTVDTAKLPTASVPQLPIGSWVILDQGVQVYNGGISTSGTTAECYKAAGGGVSNTDPITFGATDNISLRVTLPITGWSSNVTMADRAVEEYASNSSSTDANDTTSFVYGAAGSQGVMSTTVLTAARSKRVRFQTPIQATDKLFLEVFDSTMGVWFPHDTHNNGSFAYSVQNSVGYGLYLGRVAGSTTDIDVWFERYSRATGATYGAAGQEWSAVASAVNRFRVRKVSGGAQVGYPISARNIVGDTSGTAVPTGYVGQTIATDSGYSAVTTATALTLGSLALTPGVWALSGTLRVSQITSLTGTRILGLFSLSTNSTSQIDSYALIDGPTMPTAAADIIQTTGQSIVTISANTTYNFNIYALFSAGTMQAKCSIRAVRIA
jgi:hypothetical protein